MPPTHKPRRSHHKTRTGCKVCRRRKVKCDEGKPSCANCIRRELQCEYFESTASTPRADFRRSVTRDTESALSPTASLLPSQHQHPQQQHHHPPHHQSQLGSFPGTPTLVLPSIVPQASQAPPQTIPQPLAPVGVPATIAYPPSVPSQPIPPPSSHYQQQHPQHPYIHNSHPQHYHPLPQYVPQTAQYQAQAGPLPSIRTSDSLAPLVSTSHDEYSALSPLTPGAPPPSLSHTPDPNSTSNRNAPTHQSGQLPPLAALTRPPSNSHLSDLALIHHFCTQTYLTLGTTPEIHRIWQTHIPRLAFLPQHPYLLHGIIALSALHSAHCIESGTGLAPLLPDDDDSGPKTSTASQLLIASTHHHITLMQFRTAISDHHSQVTHSPATVEAVFGTSTLLVLYAFASSTRFAQDTQNSGHSSGHAVNAQPSQQYPNTHQSPLTAPLTPHCMSRSLSLHHNAPPSIPTPPPKYTVPSWLPLVRGISTVVSAGDSWKWTSEGCLAPITKGLHGKAPAATHPYADALSSLDLLVASAPPSSQGTLSAALSLLKLTYAHFYGDGDPLAAAISFAAMVEDEFVELVEGRDESDSVKEHETMATGGLNVPQQPHQHGPPSPQSPDVPQTSSHAGSPAAPLPSHPVSVRPKPPTFDNTVHSEYHNQMHSPALPPDLQPHQSIPPSQPSCGSDPRGAIIVAWYVAIFTLLDGVTFGDPSTNISPPSSVLDSKIRIKQLVTDLDDPDGINSHSHSPNNTNTNSKVTRSSYVQTNGDGVCWWIQDVARTEMERIGRFLVDVERAAGQHPETREPDGRDWGWWAGAGDGPWSRWMEWPVMMVRAADERERERRGKGAVRAEIVDDGGAGHVGCV